MREIFACLDSISHSTSVCDYSAWAAERMAAPLRLLHLIEARLAQTATPDRLSSLHFETQELLLQNIQGRRQHDLDLALDYGAHLLVAARARLMARQASGHGCVEQQGVLFDLLGSIAADAQLVVVGQHHFSGVAAGGNVDPATVSALRNLHCHLLSCPYPFKRPASFVLAFDGLLTGCNAVDTVAASALLRGARCHLVMAVQDRNNAGEKMDWARNTLKSGGFEVTSAIVAGDPQTVLHQYLAANAVDLLVMGAYSHARDRQYVAGSTIAAMLRTASVPCLVVR